MTDQGTMPAYPVVDEEMVDRAYEAWRVLAITGHAGNRDCIRAALLAALEQQQE